ncbi:hypothetical protein GF342_02285 [Candidatus Woesearchaeota archaeon]|nr:hypothetical protein [Candidatus Woesearchaeota archaeon]
MIEQRFTLRVGQSVVAEGMRFTLAHVLQDSRRQPQQPGMLDRGSIKVEMTVKTLKEERTLLVSFAPTTFDGYTIQIGNAEPHTGPQRVPEYQYTITFLLKKAPIMPH